MQGLKIISSFLILFFAFFIIPSFTHSFTLIESMIGTGQQGFSGGFAHLAQVNNPIGIAFDPNNYIYIADSGNHQIRWVDPSGSLEPLAGNGNPGYAGDGGDPLTALLRFPVGLTFAPNGGLFIADSGNHVIRWIPAGPARQIKTIAGNGTGGFSGISGSPTSISLNFPTSVATDRNGNLYIADSENHCIRKVDLSNTPTISTYGGICGQQGAYAGDGTPATTVKLNSPFALAFDSQGNLYFTDSGHHAVRKIDDHQIITTIAGNGRRGLSGDGGPATQAQLFGPTGIALNGDHTLYIADTFNNRIRQVDLSNGTIQSTLTSLLAPQGVAVKNGFLYIADTLNNRVLKIGIPNPPSNPPISGGPSTGNPPPHDINNGPRSGNDPEPTVHVEGKSSGCSLNVSSNASSKNHFLLMLLGLPLIFFILRISPQLKQKKIR